MSWTYYCKRCQQWRSFTSDDATRVTANPMRICAACGKRRSSKKPAWGVIVSPDLMQRAYDAHVVVDHIGNVTRSICTCGWNMPVYEPTMHKAECPVRHYYEGTGRKAIEILQGELDALTEATPDATL